MSILSRDRLFWIRVRVLFIVLLLLAGAAAVARGAYSLAVERRQELTDIAREQYTRRLQLSARRGLITDRWGEEMAVEVEVDSVYADPREVRDPLSAATRLSPVLALPADTLVKRLSARRHFVWLKRRVSPDVAAQVKELHEVGVHIVKEGKRFYPGRQLAAHVVGFAGVDSQGLEGVERLFDNQLQGSQDSTAGLADASGSIVFATEVLGDEKVVGDNVMLTIDRNLQFAVEEELESTVRLFQARAGHVVVMDPHTGEVLAMASWPTYNLYRIGTSDAEARRNRPVLDVFEPGSTLKVFTLAAALNSGTIRPDETTFCEHGRMEFYDVVLNDDHRDGWLNPTQCLKRSSNICFAKIAGKMGRERLYEYLRQFGFGEKTGVQVPFEMRGLLPHSSQWSEFLTATIAFGQGIGVTNIQMATALSAIANGGRLMTPSLVSKITDAQGEVQYEFAPEVRRRVISTRTARLVTDMMTAVTEEGGTGVEAAMDGYLVAGKTGTAQKSAGARGYTDKERFMASFFGFVPADKPRLVISVVIDEPLVNYFGGTVAAPAMRRIAQRALRDMGIPPSYNPQKGRADEGLRTDDAKPGAEGGGAANRAVNEHAAMMSPSDVALQEGQVRAPDVRGKNMGKVLSALSDNGLRPLFFGTGLAVEQIPAPGWPITRGEYMQVNFMPPGREETP